MGAIVGLFTTSHSIFIFSLAVIDYRNAGYIYFPAVKLLMTFHDLVSRSFVRLQLSIECAQRDDEVHSLLIENARLLIKSYTVGEFLIILKVLIKVLIMLRLEHLSYGGIN